MLREGARFNESPWSIYSQAAVLSKFAATESGGNISDTTMNLQRQNPEVAHQFFDLWQASQHPRLVIAVQIH